MKRLALSVICGSVIPFLYAISVGPVSTYIKDDTLNYLGYIPIGWPRLILYRLVPLNSFPFRDGDNTVLLVYIVGCDVVLYALLTYFDMTQALNKI